MTNTVRYPLVLFAVCTAAGLALALTFAFTYATIQQKENQKESMAVTTAFWNVEAPASAAWASFEKTTVDGSDVYLGYADAEKTKLLGYAARGEASGYSSTIKVMVAAAPLEAGRYRLLGIKVISQQETPGLGARVNDVFTTDTLWSVIGSAFASDNKDAAEPSEPIRTAAQALNVKPGQLPARPAFQAQFAGKVVSVKDGKVSGLDLQKTGWDKVMAGEFPPDEHAVSAMTGATISSRAVVAAASDAIKKIDAAARAAMVPTNE